MKLHSLFQSKSSKIGRQRVLESTCCWGNKKGLRPGWRNQCFKPEGRCQLLCAHAVFKLKNRSKAILYCQVFKWVPFSFLFPTLRAKRLSSIKQFAWVDLLLVAILSWFLTGPLSCTSYGKPAHRLKVTQIHDTFHKTHHRYRVKFKMFWLESNFKQRLLCEVQKQFGICQAIQPPQLSATCKPVLLPQRFKSIFLRLTQQNRRCSWRWMPEDSVTSDPDAHTQELQADQSRQR